MQRTLNYVLLFCCTLSLTHTHLIQSSDTKENTQPSAQHKSRFQCIKEAVHIHPDNRVFIGSLFVCAVSALYIGLNIYDHNFPDSPKRPFSNEVVAPAVGCGGLGLGFVAGAIQGGLNKYNAQFKDEE